VRAPAVKNLMSYIGVFATSLLIFGCSFKVPVDEVYGTYVATYPFGTDTLTLDRNGSFSQRAEIRNEEARTVVGQWTFNPSLSNATFHGLLIVDDGNGNLSNNWRIPSPTLVNLDVEKHWLKIVMESAAAHPYEKK
jgi:hypothetical protein